MTRRVQAPDGRVWEVRRRWLPRGSALMRLRSRMAAGGRFWRRIGEYAEAPFDFESILFVLALLAALAALAYLLVPLLLTVLELLLLVPLLVLARMLLRRPWEVEARCGEPPEMIA